MSSTAQRFGEVVLARRRELDLSQLDVWQAGGPSNTTLTEIENGRVHTLTRTTARKLDAGLHWEPGSARRVWDGGEPIPLVNGVKPEESAMWRQIIEQSDLDEAKRRELIAEIQRALDAG